MRHAPFILLSIIFWICAGGVPNSFGQLNNSSIDSLPQHCVEPITWQLAHVDPRFNITQQAIKNAMADAAGLWSKAVGKNLVSYSDSGEVAVNLMYTAGQRFSEKERELSQRMDKMKMQYTSMSLGYQQLSLQFKRKQSEYDLKLAEHAQKVALYNNIMSRWSGTGVIPREQKEQLTELKREVIFLEDKLVGDEQKLDAMAKEVGDLSGRLNAYADRVNEVVYRYKEQFSLEKTFYQGVYIEPGGDRKINIYQFDDVDKLRLVLAHELGHALGVRHVENPKSVMYYKMEEQDVQNLQLSRQDIEALQKSCKR